MLPLKLLLFVLLVVKGNYGQSPNVCKTYIDYFYMNNNTNCWYNPDIIGDAVEILKLHHVPTEVHTVTTKDGYILTMFRMTRRKAKGVVLFQPPMTGTASNYLKTGNVSLAFNLYEWGYDVWLGNSRGTFYSRRHVNMTEDDANYWAYSFEQIGMYDIPAELEYIKNATGRADVVYIGYSMAGTASFIYASVLPDHAAAHVKFFINLGPTIFYGLLPSIAHYVDFKNVKAALGYFGVHTVFESFEMADTINSRCAKSRFKVMCAISLVRYAGGSPDSIDPAFIPVLFMHIPTRVSFTVLLHFLQMSLVKRFQYFDYGVAGNLARYHSSTPPLYPLENVKVPFYIVHGDADLSCNMESMEYIYKHLPERAKIYGRYIVPKFSHIDYILGKDSKQKIVEPILKFIQKNL